MSYQLLEKFIMEKIRSSRLPSLSIAIVNNEGIIYSKAFGFRDIEKGIPATIRTIYGIGSITKSFTALAIMKLVEEGKLSLDDPIEKYLSIKLRPFGESIRVHNLLTHTSGIPALAYAEAFIRGILGIENTWLPIATVEDILTFMSDAEEWAIAKPGQKFFYLNEGYVLLGEIISRVSGMKYEDFVKKEILAPLKMSRTYFYAEDVERDSDVAVPYIIDKEGRHIRSRFPYGITADGGLLSNALDMCNYLIMYLNRGKYNDTEIVSRKSIEIMEKPYILLPHRVFEKEGYGYGLRIVEDFLGKKLVCHSGSVLVYTAYMGYIPSEGIGVVVLANASGYPLSNIGMYALAIALGKDPEKDLWFIARERILEKLQGIYETYKGTYRLSIKKHGDFILAVYRDKYLEQTAILVPIEVKDDYAKFYTFSYGRRIEIEFFINSTGITMIFERYKFVKVSDRV